MVTEAPCLARDVEDVGADDLGDIAEDLGQTIGVVLLIDVLDVALALLLGHRIADVIDVETERLGQIVEALQAQARQRYDHGDFLDEMSACAAQSSRWRAGVREPQRPASLIVSPSRPEFEQMPIAFLCCQNRTPQRAAVRPVWEVA
jgi:hypothetical protein